MGHSKKQHAAYSVGELLVIVLVAITIFLPPAHFADKRIYLIDLIALGVLIAAPYFLWTLRAGISHKTWLTYLCFVLACGFSYLHGIYRPNLQESLAIVLTYTQDNSQFGPFDFVNDTIQFTRFLSWGTGAFILWAYLRKAPFTLRIESLFTVIASMGLVQALLAAFFFFTPLRWMAGDLYGYDPDYFAWAKRFHGTLSSPMEYGGVLSITTIWWGLRFFNKRTAANAALFGISVLGLIGGNTFTWYLATALPLLWLWRHELAKRPLLIALPLIPLVVLAGIIVSGQGFRLAAEYPAFGALNIENKFENLKFRLQPWGIYLKTMFSSWDFAVLGMGFGRGHSDSGYIHLFRIGGLALVGPLTYIWVQTYRAIGAIYGQLVLACLGLAALTIDAFTLRVPAILVLIITALSIAKGRASK